MSRKLTLFFPFGAVLVLILAFLINLPRENLTCDALLDGQIKNSQTETQLIEELREARQKQIRDLYLRGGLNLILVVGLLVLLFYLLHSLEKTRRTEGQARRLAQKTVADYDSRIHAVALDLHDDIAQTMFVALTSLENSPETSTRLIRESLHKLRTLSRRLRPGEAVSLPLKVSLEKLTQEMAANSPFSIHYQCHGTAGIKLPPEMRIQIYRMVQEALTNAAKHSKADQVQVTVLGSYPKLTLKVCDNGVGITHPETALYQTSHLGIRSLQERTELLRGQFNLQSNRGTGTIITVTIPVEEYWHEDT